jgi:hypothetical protein
VGQNLADIPSGERRNPQIYTNKQFKKKWTISTKWNLFLCFDKKVPLCALPGNVRKI